MTGKDANLYLGVFKLKKSLAFLLIFSILYVTGCLNNASFSVQGEAAETLNNFIKGRIEMFSEKHFSKLRKCEVSFTENEGSLYVEFVPDFGSITFKNEIWQWAAAHAMNLIYLFPEIKEYRYSVYDSKNNKLMDLYLDETGIKLLPEKFYGKRGPGGFYRYCFTKVELTKIGNELPLDEDFFDGSQLP
ncbi:MAG: hypothetical protein ACOWWO_13355 [Peptococcaceae bacterium]